jgi:uncharacterized membrane protein YeaQ/YmgE (transglycosylase-associated protein family)
MPVIVTVVVAFLFGAAAGNVVGSLTNHGEDRFGNIAVGAVGGAIGSLLLQFMVPALSGFDDWRASLSGLRRSHRNGSKDNRQPF